MENPAGLPTPLMDLPGYGQEGPRPGKQRIKTAITHDQIIDFVLANPGATNTEIGHQFGYTPQGICVLMNSDAFKARYVKRRQDIVDPLVMATLDDRLNGLAARSAEIVHEQLDLNPADKRFALEVMKASTSSLGLGGPKTPAVNLGFVVHLPGPAASTSEWQTRFAPKHAEMVMPAIEDAPSETQGD